MKIAKIPHNINYTPITTLSPSKYTLLKEGCPLSFIGEKALGEMAPNGLALTMPPVTTKNVIGTIIHSIFESVGKGTLEPCESAITEEWERQCSLHKARIENRFPSLKGISICDYDAMFDTIDIALSMARNDNKVPSFSQNVSFKTPFEHRVVVPNLLAGSIDRIRFTQAGYDIIDYKTGKVYDESGNIKPEYVEQLNLYALMLEYAEKAAIHGLFIIDRTGTEISVPYYRERKEEFKSSVKELIDRINSAIRSQSFQGIAFPSEQTCKYCTFQHLCPYRYVNPNSPLHIVEGSVSHIWNKDQISIHTSSRKDVIIAKLNPLDIEEYDNLLGKHLIIVNLFEVINNELYNRTDRTVLYERL